MDNQLRWFWLCGSHDIDHPSGTIPLGSRWREVVDSATSYPFRATLLGRSLHADVEHDETRAPVWGHVERWRELTRDEAISEGLEQSDDAALYAGVMLTRAGQMAYDAGELLYVSPRISRQYQDETGREWPWVIEHVAACGTPYQQLTQPPQYALASVSLRRGGMEASEIEDVVDTVIEEIADDEGVTVEAVESEASSEISRLWAAIEELRLAMAGTPDVDASSDDDDEDGSSELSRLRRELAKRTAELARRDAVDAVNQLRRERVTDAPADVLVDLHRRDKRAFELMRQALPKRKTPTVSKRQSAGASLSRGVMTLDERVRKFVAEGHSWSESIKLAQEVK